MQQKPAADGSSPSNPTIMEVSRYVIVHTSSTQGHGTRAIMWTRSLSKRLSALKIPLSAVTDKLFEFVETPGPANGIVPTATSDLSVVLVLVHLANQSSGDVWSAAVINEERIFTEELGLV